jgi:hypothetical protein
MKVSLLAATAVAALLLESPAGAVTLIPPANPVAPDVFSTIPTGPLEASTGGTFTSSGGATDYTGNYTARVISDTARGGLLDFLYKFTVTGGANDIGRVTASDFTGFTTDVGYVTGTNSGAAGIPITVDRTTGSPVGFNFGAGLGTGVSSAVLVIETNATLWTAGNLSFLNNKTSDNAAFAPMVPEPSTWAMILTGFGLLGFAAMRKGKREARLAV